MTTTSIDPATIDRRKLYRPKVLSAVLGITTKALDRRVERDPKRYSVKRIANEPGYWIPGYVLLRFFVGVESAARTTRETEEQVLASAKELV